ncbi:MAG: transcription antitermination factor NusB [Prevotellaceae bacterium]|jgi:N utilization substance protein B|nr:transcription antitermination factor NusB [Prevotellaceae bacterium]
MINRILLRIKIVQILYSYYKSDAQSIEKVENELFFSIEKAYDLYFYLLLLMADLTAYAAERINRKKQMLTASAEDKNPNMRFINNRFVAQLAKNKELLAYIDKQKISWHQHAELIKELYETITASEIYTQYMQSKDDSYQNDKEVWRMIFKKMLSESEILGKELEEISIYWNDDAETVISFLLKTIKQFDEANGINQPLLSMFKDDEDRVFAKELLRNAIYDGKEYKDMIQEHTQNWEVDRLAFMDMIIMQAALAEVHTFPSIPVNVTMNEYIEIAKYYSTAKSSVFINGILDSIIDKLRKDNKIIKVAYYTPSAK